MKKNISTEKTLTIFYCFAIQKPKKQNDLPEDDWISNISNALFDSVDFRNPYIVSKFNGNISVYCNEEEMISNCNISKFSIKTVKIIEKFINK